MRPVESVGDSMAVFLPAAAWEGVPTGQVSVSRGEACHSCVEMTELSSLDPCLLLPTQKRLLEAMAACNHSLKEEERQRNQHSECLMCWHDAGTEFTYPSPWPGKFPDIRHCCTR